MDPNNPQNGNGEDKPKELNYQQDIHNKPIEELVAEQHAAEAEFADEWNNPPAEEKKTQASEPETQTTPQSTPPPEQNKPAVEENPAKAQPATPQTAPQTPGLSPDELAEKITKQVVENLNPTTPEEKKTLEQKLSDLQEKAKAEGREVTYAEALKFLKEETQNELSDSLTEVITKKVMDNLNKEVAQEQEAQKQREEAQRKETEKNQQVMYKEWDRQVGILQTDQAFPKIVDKNDKNDPGVIAQARLFKALNMRAEIAKKAGQPVSFSLIEAFHSPQYKQLLQDEQKNAPVYGARRGVGNDAQGELKYSDIHNASMEDILREHYDKQGWS